MKKILVCKVNVKNIDEDGYQMLMNVNEYLKIIVKNYEVKIMNVHQYVEMILKLRFVQCNV
jgi:hypothetical protein